MIRIDMTDEVDSFNTKNGVMRKQIGYAHMPASVAQYPVKIKIMIRNNPVQKGSYQFGADALYVDKWGALALNVNEGNLRPLTSAKAA